MKRTRMTKRDKIGMWVFIAVFIVFGLVLAMTIERSGTSVSSFSDSVIVKQRVKNIRSR